MTQDYGWFAAANNVRQTRKAKVAIGEKRSPPLPLVILLAQSLGPWRHAASVPRSDVATTLKNLNG